MTSQRPRAARHAPVRAQPPGLAVPGPGRATRYGGLGGDGGSRWARDPLEPGRRRARRRSCRVGAARRSRALQRRAARSGWTPAAGAWQAAQWRQQGPSRGVGRCGRRLRAGIPKRKVPRRRGRAGAGTQPAAREADHSQVARLGLVHRVSRR